MFLENVVFDAVDPQRLGQFWESAIGGQRLADGAAGFETRLAIDSTGRVNQKGNPEPGPEGEPVLDFCFQPVQLTLSEPPRLHLDLAPGSNQAEEVDRLLGLGARHLNIGQGDVPWVVLADPEGNPFCVLEDRPEYVNTGPLAAFALDSADPARDADFWKWLTGWVAADGSETHALRHRSLVGPFVEFCVEHTTKGAAKNRIHLDVRLETGDDPDEVAAEITQRGGIELHPGWGELPWRVYADPSGNEFCVLAARG